MQTNRLITGFFSIISLASVSTLAAPNLVNGSLTGPIANGGVPSGWSVLAGSPDTMDENHNVGVTFAPFIAQPVGPSPDGGTWVGFARDINSGGFQEIFGQLVSGFNVGSEYEISWYEGNFGAQVAAGYGQPNKIGVTLNGSFAGAGALLGLDRLWSSDSLVFTADASDIQINFGLTEAGPSYLSIDGIRISEVGVSTPDSGTSVALLGLGFAGVLALKKRVR